MKHPLKTVAVIIAHPDDETLWAGGLLLSHPEWHKYIACLCRKNDADRAPRFQQVLKQLNAQGIMGNLDDGPEQVPLAEDVVEQAILQLLPQRRFDLVISHNPNGEYTRHLRHEEISRAVIKLWHAGKIITNELWTFAYEDGGRQYYPRPVKTADLYIPLTYKDWQHKYHIMTKTYGFQEDGWEARTCPQAEAFWQFTSSGQAVSWLNQGGRP
ncbi:PIG-L family deacetylase [Pedobacter sp. BS3]|uniref:PIG-L deacetylase family protein n=1 Tax=Pedobacter sp. BS3 TaxID=2567937 RepID=UPI0011ED3ADA|nr:PIG-L family deacetylase [Pedobacter sp. BS3]TZF83868.1 PIG-L family deacetylase [Pedobacter sp. BS3]